MVVNTYKCRLVYDKKNMDYKKLIITINKLQKEEKQPRAKLAIYKYLCLNEQRPVQSLSEF